MNILLSGCQFTERTERMEPDFRLNEHYVFLRGTNQKLGSVGSVGSVEEVF